MHEDLPPPYDPNDDEPQLPSDTQKEVQDLRNKTAEYLSQRQEAGKITGQGIETDPYTAESGDIRSVIDRILEEKEPVFFYFQFNEYLFMINAAEARLIVECVSALHSNSQRATVELYKDLILKAVQDWLDFNN